MTALRIRGVEDVTISVHGHDDLGMAVANFMSAIEGGARQVRDILSCRLLLLLFLVFLLSMSRVLAFLVSCVLRLCCFSVCYRAVRPLKVDIIHKIPAHSASFTYILFLRLFEDFPLN